MTLGSSDFYKIKLNTIELSIIFMRIPDGKPDINFSEIFIALKQDKGNI